MTNHHPTDTHTAADKPLILSSLEIDDGFFVFSEPLSPGKHDLQLKTNVINPINPSYNYSADLLYHLIVKP